MHVTTKTILRAGALVATLAVVAGCNEKSSFSKLAGANAQVSPKLRAEMKKNDMPLTSPVVARVFKEESKVEIWKQKSNGRYGLLASYDICKYSGKLGPKFTEGDRQAPEGFYTVRPAQMNPNSKYHLSFDIGYPNKFDRAWGRSGANLMVHGACSSSGCYSMTDPQIEEIYAVAREAFKGGQQEFQIQAYPFRMSAANMARYRNDNNYDFWKNLKEGYDYFEVNKVPPKVDVCEKRYVFDVTSANGAPLSATGACPASTAPVAMSSAYQSYQKTYNASFSSASGKSSAPAPKPSIQGLKEAKLVSDWTKRRARGERISMDPPSMQPDGSVVVTPRMGRATNEAGRKMAAKEAAEATKKKEAEDKAAAAAEAKRLKEEAKAAKAGVDSATAQPVEQTAEQTAATPVIEPAAPVEEDTGVVSGARKRLGKLFGG